MHRIHYDIILYTAAVWMSQRSALKTNVCYCMRVMSTCQTVVCVKVRKWQRGDYIICPSEKLWHKWKQKRKKHHLSNRRRKKNPCFIFNQRALVEVLHVYLSFPLRAFLYFLRYQRQIQLSWGKIFLLIFVSLRLCQYTCKSLQRLILLLRGRFRK